MSKTKIEWAERVWNPVRGCSRVSEGCRNCYAERLAARFAGRGEPFYGFAKVVAPRDHLDRVGGRRNGWTGRVELVPSKLAEPLRWKKPARVFVNSMSDLFHESLPDDAIDQVFAVMALASQHTFIVLTKRAELMRRYMTGPRLSYEDFVSFAAVFVGPECDSDAVIDAAWGRYHDGLPNLWLGVSVEDQWSADERIPHLLATPAAKRVVSYEPALKPVDFRKWIPHIASRVMIEETTPSGKAQSRCEICGNVSSGHERECRTCAMVLNPLHWVIVGGESGPGARLCEVAWIRSAVEQCKDAGVPCFVKQLGAFVIENYNTWFANRWGTASFGDFGRVSRGTARVRLRSRKGSDPSEWPEDLRVREWPEASHADV